MATKRDRLKADRRTGLVVGARQTSDQRRDRRRGARRKARAPSSDGILGESFQFYLFIFFPFFLISKISVWIPVTLCTYRQMTDEGASKRAQHFSK